MFSGIATDEMNKYYINARYADKYCHFLTFYCQWWKFSKVYRDCMLEHRLPYVFYLLSFVIHYILFIYYFIYYKSHASSNFYRVSKKCWKMWTMFTISFYSLFVTKEKSIGFIWNVRAYFYTCRELYTWE